MIENIEQVSKVNKSEPYSRDIIILANSKKNYGHCIAGKDIHTGEWVRVVIDNSERSFKNTDLKKLYENEYGPKILESVRIQFSYKCPLNYHPEDEFINGEPWKKLGIFKKSVLEKFLDDDENDWFHKISKSNDKISNKFFNISKLTSSLDIRKLTFDKNGTEVIYVLNFDKTAYRPCLKFVYKGISYKLKITDFAYEQNSKIQYNPRALKEAYVMVGLGEEYKGYHYKLVVGLIETDMINKSTME